MAFLFNFSFLSFISSVKAWQSPLLDNSTLIRVECLRSWPRIEQTLALIKEFFPVFSSLIKTPTKAELINLLAIVEFSIKVSKYDKRFCLSTIFEFNAEKIA